jgi:hypothetical protein
MMPSNRRRQAAARKPPESSLPCIRTSTNFLEQFNLALALLCTKLYPFFSYNDNISALSGVLCPVEPHPSHPEILHSIAKQSQIRELSTTMIT